MTATPCGACIPLCSRRQSIRARQRQSRLNRPVVFSFTASLGHPKLHCSNRYVASHRALSLCPDSCLSRLSRLVAITHQPLNPQSFRATSLFRARRFFPCLYFVGSLGFVKNTCMLHHTSILGTSLQAQHESCLATWQYHHWLLNLNSIAQDALIHAWRSVRASVCLLGGLAYHPRVQDGSLPFTTSLGRCPTLFSPNTWSATRLAFPTESLSPHITTSVEWPAHRALVCARGRACVSWLPEAWCWMHSSIAQRRA